MENLPRLVRCLLLLILLPAAAGAREMEREILGLRLEMPKAEVQQRLTKIGRFVRDERKLQQVWEVRDKSFSHLVVGFDPKDLLRYVTAVVREDNEAQRIKYAEVGNLSEARQAGNPEIKNFNYQWSLPLKDGDGEMLVIVRGRDPEFLNTYSLKSVRGEDKGAD